MSIHARNNTPSKDHLKPHPFSNNLVFLSLLLRAWRHLHLHYADPPRQRWEDEYLAQVHDGKPRPCQPEKEQFEIVTHVRHLHEIGEPLSWVRQHVGREEEGCHHGDDERYYEGMH